MKPTIVVYDGMNAAHRFRHAYSELSVLLPSKSGGMVCVKTGVLYGITEALRNAFESNADAVVFAWDAYNPWRKDLYPAYKSSRAQKRGEYTEEEQKDWNDFQGQQLPLCRKVLRMLGVPQIEAPRMEADDIIGSLTRVLTSMGANVEIVSTDHDMIQLVSGKKCCVRNPITDVYYYEGNNGSVSSTRGEVATSARTFLWKKAATGDVSDSIEGIKGVGKGTADKLFAQPSKPGESLVEYLRSRYLTNAKVRERSVFENIPTLERNLSIMDLRYEYSERAMRSVTGMSRADLDVGVYKNMVVFLDAVAKRSWLFPHPDIAHEFQTLFRRLQFNWAFEERTLEDMLSIFHGFYSRLSRFVKTSKYSTEEIRDEKRRTIKVIPTYKRYSEKASERCSHTRVVRLPRSSVAR